MPAVLQLRVHDPDAEVWMDVSARRLIEPPERPAAAEVSIDADALHHLLLDHLGPVEISRLAEEGRVELSGPPLVLGALLPLTAAIQPHYAASLEERGRGDLLAVPAAPTGEVWQSEAPPPAVIGVRRPWQRPRGSG
jgi:ubiquinone biosynthesis protein UbiJ